MATVKETKVRKQGNSLVLLVPKSFNIDENTKMIPELTKNGIFYKFAQDNFWDFDDKILEDLVNQGYEGKKLISKFKEMKSNIPSAIDEIATKVDKDAQPLTQEEFEKEIGL
ncbi:toxin-antitoxin system [Lactobacillus sp. LL6]|uniref:toxin-antitoxin system n=1 Tax=Lactobacillus sp. LL6 TaxID=2596827 RepID=UPI001184BBF4|nr:toxin-antitoxin system [Lactobacillus sp. LL6]TSO26629.1 toxin-antitoxin system [Lactobacillus sp. LL6]